MKRALGVGVHTKTLGTPLKSSSLALRVLPRATTDKTSPRGSLIPLGPMIEKVLVYEISTELKLIGGWLDYVFTRVPPVRAEANRTCFGNIVSVAMLLALSVTFRSVYEAR